MTYQEIKNFINTYIVANGVGAITGARLNTALNELADYKGFDAVVVTTLPAGSDATATVQGMTLVIGIPRGADGQDGQNAINPFKGWFNSLDDLKDLFTASAGDSAYVKDASPATTWSIYVYDETATTDNNWADSGMKADTSNVQTFASGEEVNQTYIDDTKLVNPLENSLAKADDVAKRFEDIESLIVEDNEVDFSSLTKIAGGVSVTNKWNNVQSGSTHYLIPIEEGSTVTVTGIQNYNTYIAWLTSDAAPVQNGDVPMVTGTGRVFVGDETIKVIAPQTTRFVLVCADLYSSGSITDRTPSAMSIKSPVSSVEHLIGNDDVEDNLFSKETTKVLSANQGRLLNLGQMKAIAITPNRGDGNNRRYINSASVWENTSTSDGGTAHPSYACFVTPVHAGETYRLTPTYTNGTPNAYNACFLHSDSVEIGASPDFCAGQTTIQPLTTDEQMITAPADANFLYVLLIYHHILVAPNIDKLIPLNEYEDEKATRRTSVYLGSTIQCGFSATGIDYTTPNSTRVCVGSVVAVPFDGCTLRFKLPSDVMVGVRHGATANNLATNSYWFFDGQTFTFPATSKYYLLCFGNGMGSSLELTTQYVDDCIADGRVAITYDEKSIGDVIATNIESEKYIKSVRRVFVNKEQGGDPNQHPEINANMFRLPTFVHTSDIHGDYIRTKRFIEYAEYLQVDAAFITGDMTAYTNTNRCDFVNDLIDDCDTMALLCMGNHDAYEGNKTAEEQYNNVMKRNIEKYECVVNPNVTYPTYYYKDIADKKIRIIALNSYEGGFTHSTVAYYSQSQINWFIDALVTTPQNYGVIVLMHAPENPITKEVGYEKFWQDNVAITQQYQYSNFKNSATPIGKIVDAFVSGVVLNTSFEEKNPSATYDTITISADFTQKNTGVDFLFFLCGHEHSDRIGYARKTDWTLTNNLLVMNVTCGISKYAPSYGKLAELSDLPRDDYGSIQDSFNFIAVDRDNGVVRIARVGSNVTSSLAMRDYMEIHYR